MPRLSRHTLSWSPDHTCYELSTQGQLERTFAPEDTEGWLTWLERATSFTFQGTAGRLNVYQEMRRNASYYWYASATSGNRTRKRYLGHTASVTFARLEETASTLHHTVSAPSSSIKQITASQDEMPGRSEQGKENWQESMPDMPLPVTRFVPPLLPSDPVVREHLLARLDVARTRQLTLLSASAGWGKTTLLSLWTARSRFPVAWLSLDVLDNDPGRFWASVMAALRYSGAYPPLVGEKALEMLRSSQLFCLNTILTMLLNDLSVQNTPVFLLLDDYHMIEEQAIHDSLLFLLEHLPAHLHLIIASRTDPPLSLARLRARGTLLELRDADLRFQEDEAAAFLTRTMALSLEPAEIAQLAQRTEGWVAGLHLAALALPRQQDRAAFVRGFTGSHRYLLDYVQEDILARVAQPLQDFLLRCSILRRMSAALCQIVMEQADLQTSQQMLEALERANLFLVPLDEERRWYRLHDLFREALLARLHTTEPALVPLLHKRAASVYEQDGEWSEAITHRLAAQDYDAAVAVMEQTAEHFWLRGETTTLFHWITVLPDEVIRARADFILKVAGYLLNTSVPTVKAQLRLVRTQIERLLVRVEESLLCAEEEHQQDQAGALYPPPRLLRQRVYLVRSMNELNELEANNDWKQYALLAQQVLQVSQDDEIFWQMIPLDIAFTYRYTVLHEGAFLVPRLLEAKQQANQSGDRLVMIKVRQWLALASLQAGQLHRAYQENLEALALLEHLQGYALLRGYFSHCQAYIFFEWNQLDEAREVLRKMIPDAAAWQQIDLQAWGYRLLAEVEVAAGNLLTATQVLQEAQLLFPEEKGLYQIWRTGIQARLWLALGNMAEANAWAARVVYHHNDWKPPYTREFLTRIHVYLAQQQYSRALEILEEFRDHLDQPGNIDDTIYFLSFYATVLHQTGRRGQAREVALRLLTLTEPEGYLRIYLDVGQPMKQLLQSLLDAPQDQGEEISPVPGSYIASLLAAFAADAQKQAERSEAQQPGHSRKQEAQTSRTTNRPGSISGKAGLLETLTPQELRVLRLLAAGRSNQEIAHELVVALNTVKSHVKNLYGKLQVSSRTQALALARDLQVL